MLVLGNKNLLNEKLAVILNSSQSKTPCGCDSWVERTSSIARNIVNDGYVIITSVGLTAWELMIYLVGINSGRQIILSPVTVAGHENELFANVIADFELNPDMLAMIFPESEPIGRSPKKNWPIRDNMAVEMAQTIFPVSIKPEGRLDTLLKNQVESGKIDCRFQVDYSTPAYHPAGYSTDKLSMKIEKWDYITHWTKTRYGPWPGERRTDFYKRLLESGNEYPNNAFNTLKNIMSERKIRASSNKIRDSYPVIGFTECHPDDTLKMLRWCPRRVNWNFEPYGIAIKKAVAEKMGAGPVIYGTVDDYKKFSESAKPFFQNRGENDVDWSREREWRHVGDIDLSLLGADQIIYLVWDEIKAKIVRSMTVSPVMACNND